MKKTSVLNTILIISIYLITIYLIIPDILNKDIYEILIKLAVFPVLLIPKIFKKFIKINDIEETIYIFFVFIAFFLGSILNLYNRIYCYDTIIHFLSGFATSFLAIDILKRNKVVDNNIMLNTLFILSFSLFVAASWEIFEFTNDNLFGKDAQKVLITGVDDTMKDIIVAALASILTSISYLYEHINNKNIIIKKFEKNIRG